MIQLDNRTSLTAGLFPGWSRQGQRQQTLVIKVGYKFDNQGKLTPTALPLITADEYRAEPENSSLSAVGETMPYKTGGELYLYGSAQPVNGGHGSSRVAVRLKQKQQNWQKELQVYGVRQWQRKLLTILPGRPSALDEEVELCYENAYGGYDPHNQAECFAANPAGCGYSIRGLRSSGLILPQVETITGQITSPGSRVEPAGFGPLAPHWEPRSKLSYNIDEQAIGQGLYPFAAPPPEEIYNVAPLDQRFKVPFSRKLTLQLCGLIPEVKELKLQIDRTVPRIRIAGIGPSCQIEALCDTMIVDCHQRTIAFLLRSAILLDENNLDPNAWVSILQPELSSATQIEQEYV